MRRRSSIGGRSQENPHNHTSIRSKLDLQTLEWRTLDYKALADSLQQGTDHYDLWPHLKTHTKMGNLQFSTIFSIFQSYNYFVAGTSTEMQLQSNMLLLGTACLVNVAKRGVTLDNVIVYGLFFGVFHRVTYLSRHYYTLSSIIKLTLGANH